MNDNQLLTCNGCGELLPLLPATATQWTSPWACNACGAITHGVLSYRVAPGLRDRVRLAEDQESPAGQNSSPPPQPTSNISSPSVNTSPTALERPGGFRAGALKCDIETQATRRLETELAQANLAVNCTGRPFAEKVMRHGSARYDPARKRRFQDSYNDAAGRVGRLYNELQAGASVELHTAEQVSRESLAQAQEDLDMFVTLSLSPTTQEYPFRHALKVTMLAMAIGTTLEWDEPTILELGVGCLIHDVGMLKLDAALYESPRVCDLAELAAIARHPIHTINLIAQQQKALPLAARSVAFQMHERCDGTGYPRGISGAQIHELARVAAVADVFVALTSPRPHRPAILPHAAIRSLLYAVRDGQFHGPAVRGLLHTVSLFPTGSPVLLSDGRTGVVARANGPKYTAPVVELGSQHGGQHETDMLDLSTRSDLKIASALESLPAC